jgi:hypothetical protein
MNKLDFGFLPVVWEVAGLTITPYLLVLPICLFLYLFLVWVFLSKDHNQEEIVSLSLGTVIVLLVGGRITNILLNLSSNGFNISSWFSLKSIGEINFLAGLFFMFIYISIVCLNHRLSIWYFLEKFVFPVSIIAFIINLALFFSNAQVIFFGRTLIFLIILLSGKLLSGYRSFVWYSSGRAGFLFFAIVAEYFFLAIILSFFLPEFSYWQLVANVLILLVSLIGVYLLSGKKLKKTS